MRNAHLLDPSLPRLRTMIGISKRLPWAHQFRLWSHPNIPKALLLHTERVPEHGIRLIFAIKLILFDFLEFIGQLCVDGHCLIAFVVRRH
jgi:hypothetical protein